MHFKPDALPCPAASSCEFNDPSAPPCGTAPDQRAPLSPAEEVCPRALAGLLNRWQNTDRGPVTSAIVHTQLAWGEHELGLQEPSDERASAHFQRAEAHADAALGDMYASFDATFSAALLRIYTPLFQAGRRQPRPIEKAEFLEVRRNIGSLRHIVRTVPVHEGQAGHRERARAEGVPHTPCLTHEGLRQDARVRLLGLELALRQRILLYPASPRERNVPGEMSAQRHDSYALDGSQKVPVRLRLQGKGAAQGHEVSATILSIRGMAISAIARMRTMYSQYAHIEDERVEIAEIEEMLDAEVAGSAIGDQELTFLNEMGKVFEKYLPFKYVPLSAPLGREVETAASPEPIIVDASLYKGDIKNGWTPHQAAEFYHRDGNTRRSPRRLERLILAMRDSKDAFVSTTCAGVYLDLARHPLLDPEQAVGALEAALAHVPQLEAQDFPGLSGEELSHRLRWELQRAYGEKYRKTFQGQTLGLEEEGRLFSQLLELGRSTLKRGAAQKPGARGVRSVQFEIGIHLLNSRRNLRNRTILRTMWPSLPREHDPHDYRYERRTGWDAGFSGGDFLNQDLSCRYLQLKGVSDATMYHPDITVIVGRDDLHTATTAEIISLALKEVEGTPADKANATKRLDEIEADFLATLGIAGNS